MKGGLGMWEMLVLILVIIGVGLGDKVGLVIDGRFFGGIYGMVVGYVVLEVVVGGAIVLVEEGDMIIIDVYKCLLWLNIFDEELEKCC